LAANGITARIGLAGTPRAAAALARLATSSRAPVRIVLDGDLRTSLAPLPVEGLMLPADAVTLLNRLGLRRIGDLYDLPRAALARRFRAEARVMARGARAAEVHASHLLGRLDQMLGHASDPRTGLIEPAHFIVRRMFETPLVSAEPIAGVVRELAADLTRDLEQAALGAQRFTLWLYRADQSVARTAIATSRPVRDARHVARLLEARIDTLDAGFGIDALVLEATRTAPLAEINQTITSGQSSKEDGARNADALVDRLVNRLGTHAVSRLARVASHVPERADRIVPALDDPALDLNRSVASCLPLSSALRPPLILAAPEPIRVLADVPEGPPARFVWRRRPRTIVRHEGPERIAGEWWRTLRSPAAVAEDEPLIPTPRSRDYYRLEDELGCIYWVFRHGRYQDFDAEDGSALGLPRWFMHGMFA
jgi:protein ImuB